MIYFKKDIGDFFNRLAVNNNKEWFHAHKSEYEEIVKIPFENLVNDLIGEFSKFEDLRGISAKECILRINRDIRFSKDKSTYNLHVTACISRGGKKDKTIPGIFLRVSPQSIGIMGGCYKPASRQVTKIRWYIKENAREFQRLKENPDFINKFETIRGDGVKRIPGLLKTSAKTEPLILNKQWYFVAEREPELLYSENLLLEMMQYYCAAKSLNEFFKKAIG